MSKYKEFIPKSASEVKVSHDPKLGELAEQLWNYMNDDGLLKDKDWLYDKNFNRFFSVTHEYNREEVKEALSERTYNFLCEKIYKYLEVEESRFVKADWMKKVEEHQRDLIYFGSRVPGVLPSKTKENVYGCHFWQSGIFHMDYGFSFSDYKFIIYLDDVEKNEGGVTFTDPIITPYLEDGSPRWEGNQGTLKLNVEPKTVDELTIDEKIGPKGTVVCFNSHVAHTARFPRNNQRRAIHFVFSGPQVEPYFRTKQPVTFETNPEYILKRSS